MRISRGERSRGSSFAQPGSLSKLDAVQQLQHVHVFEAARAFHFQAIVLLSLEQGLLIEKLRHDAARRLCSCRGRACQLLSRRPWNDSFKASRSAAMTLRSALCSGPLVRQFDLRFHLPAFMQPCAKLTFPFAFRFPAFYNQLPWAIPSSFIFTSIQTSASWTARAKPPLRTSRRSLAPENARRGHHTHHGNLFAAANFFYEASKRDVKPIIGCEVYVAKGSRHDRGEKSGPAREWRTRHGIRARLHAAPTISSCSSCENLEGYHNLIKLVSSGFLEGFYYKPRIDLRLLSANIPRA